MIYLSNLYMLPLSISKKDAQTGYHAGQCDADIAALVEEPKIKRQLAKLDPEKIRLELAEEGAWDETELADHEENLKRFLWIACAEVLETLSSREG